MKYVLLSLLFAFVGAVTVQAQKKPYQALMQNDNVRYQDVKAEFEKAREADDRIKAKAIRKARRKGLPEPEFEEDEDLAKFYRWERWRLRHLGPNGIYDPAFVPQELARFDQTQVRIARMARKIANPRWKELGPLTTPTVALNNDQSLLNGPNVGRIGAVAFHPTDANTYYAATPGKGFSGNAGGIWKTTDNGQSWTPLSDQLADMVVTDVAVSAKNPQLLYTTGNIYAAGTGGGTAGYGIQKSTDGGATWVHTPFRVSYKFNAAGSQGIVGRANNVLIDPADDAHLIVTCINAILYSTNGGLTWTKAVTPVADYLADYWDIEFKPGDPSVVYVGGSGREQLLKSTDGGKTFTQIQMPSTFEVGSIGRIELAVSAAAPDFLYMLTSLNTEKQGGVYRLNTATDALRVIVASGKTFSSQQQERDDTQLRWCMTMAVSPTDTNEMHVGMVAMLSSYDGGRSWEYRYNGVTLRAGDIHADVSSLNFQPGTNRLFVTSDGGLHGATGKKGAPFRYFNNIAVSQIYSMAQAASRSERIAVGLQDNGSKLYDGTTWQQISGGDGMSCIIDDNNPNVFYMTAQSGYLLRVVNNSVSYLTPAGVTGDNTSFYSPLDYHQATKTLFLGSNSLWRKNEQSYFSQWENVKTFGGETIQDVFVAPSDVKTIYVRTYQFTNSVSNYRLYVSTDAGITWTKVLGDGFEAYITAMVVNPNNSKTIYASRYVPAESTYHVMKSADNGRTWTTLTGNLPHIASNAITIQEGTDEGIYVAMDQGVYYKDNSMGQWVRYGVSLPNAPVFDLDVDYTGGKIKAATHGRGVWEAELAVPVGQVSALVTNRREVCAGATVGISFLVSKGTAGVNSYAVQLSGATGSFASPLALTTVATTSATVTLPPNLPMGTGYLIRVLRNNNIATADTSDALSVLNLPTAVLNGPAEVVFGQPASLTVTFGGSGPWTYRLNNDSLRLSANNAVVQSVTLTQGTAYSLTSLSNVCGNGTVSGNPRVTVIPTLAVTGLALPGICAGQTGSLSAVQGGAFNGSSGYIVQLSDATGSFAAPTVVGLGPTSPLSFSIAENQTAGAGYRLRVVGNTTERVETTPGPAFAINVKPRVSIAAVGDSSILQTTTARLRLSFTGTAPFQYTLTNGTTGVANAATEEITVKPNQTTTYAVAAVANGCGAGTAAGRQTIIVIPLLSIDPAKAPVVTLLPNPAGEAVRVETSLSGPHDVILYDVVGRERLRRHFQQQADVSLQSLAKGIYVYRIITPKGAVEGRLLVE